LVNLLIYEAWKQKEVTLSQVYDMFPRLKERQRQLVGTLSGGELQMVAIGRGLMSRPKLCVFDEPSYGLAPLLVKEIFRIVQGLRERGIAILLIEQNVRQTLEIADRAYVLENGRIVSEGKSGELLQNDHIKKAYLSLLMTGWLKITLGDNNRQQVFLFQSGQPEGIREGSIFVVKYLSAILSLGKSHPMMFGEDNYPGDF
jgi:ABC-type multidrug transport system ATPase subunit